MRGTRPAIVYEFNHTIFHGMYSLSLISGIQYKMRKSRGQRRVGGVNGYSKRRQVDLTTSFGSIGNVWIIEDSCLLAAGTDISQRIGRAVTIQSLDVDGLLVGGQVNGALDDNYNVARLVVFLGRPGLVSADWAGRTFDDPVNPGVEGVTRVLHDSQIILRVPAADSVGYIPAVARVQRHIKAGVKAYYGSAASSVPTAGDSLFFALITDSSAVPNPGFTHGYYRLNFSDVRP